MYACILIQVAYNRYISVLCLHISFFYARGNLILLYLPAWMIWFNDIECQNFFWGTVYVEVEVPRWKWYMTRSPQWCQIL